MTSSSSSAQRATRDPSPAPASLFPGDPPRGAAGGARLLALKPPASYASCATTDPRVPLDQPDGAVRHVRYRWLPEADETTLSRRARPTRRARLPPGGDRSASGASPSASPRAPDRRRRRPGHDPTAPGPRSARRWSRHARADRTGDRTRNGRRRARLRPHSRDRRHRAHGDPILRFRPQAYSAGWSGEPVLRGPPSSTEPRRTASAPAQLAQGDPRMPDLRHVANAVAWNGRIPVDNATHAFDVAVHQVRASPTGSPSPPSGVAQVAPHVLDGEELTVLTASAEAVVEAVSHAPERAAEVLTDGRPGLSGAPPSRCRSRPLGWGRRLSLWS